MIDIAHVHPMLVHFPIVLYLLAIGLQFLVLLRNGDLAANACLANSAFVALLLAGASAVVAAFFGDKALDHAISLGFPSAPLETHATFGISTMAFMLIMSAVHIAARWSHWTFSGMRGYLMLIVGAVGVVLLMITAYHGGNLVYQIGVNVHSVTP